MDWSWPERPMVTYRLTKKGWSYDRVMKKIERTSLLRFVLGLLLILEATRHRREPIPRRDQTLFRFQTKGLQELPGNDQEIKHFQWPSKLWWIWNCLKQSQHPEPAWKQLWLNGKRQKFKHKDSSRGTTVLVLTMQLSKPSGANLYLGKKRKTRVSSIDGGGTNLLTQREISSSEKEIITEKSNKGAEFAQLIKNQEILNA